MKNMIALVVALLVGTFVLVPSAYALEGFYKGDAYGVTTYTNEDGHQRIELSNIISCAIFSEDGTVSIEYADVADPIVADYSPSKAAGSLTFGNSERTEALNFLTGQLLDKSLEDLGISAETLAQASSVSKADGSVWVDAYFPSRDGQWIVGVTFLKKDTTFHPSEYMVLTRSDSCA